VVKKAEKRRKPRSAILQHVHAPFVSVNQNWPRRNTRTRLRRSTHNSANRRNNSKLVATGLHRVHRSLPLVFSLVDMRVEDSYIRMRPFVRKRPLLLVDMFHSLNTHAQAPHSRNNNETEEFIRLITRPRTRLLPTGQFCLLLLLTRVLIPIFLIVSRYAAPSPPLARPQAPSYDARQQAPVSRKEIERKQREDELANIRQAYFRSSPHALRLALCVEVHLCEAFQRKERAA
jgi:hypothetical protein